MRKLKNKDKEKTIKNTGYKIKNWNVEARKSEINTLQKISARKLYMQSREFVVLACISTIESRIRDLATQSKDDICFTKEQEKKIDRLHKYSVNYIKKMFETFRIEHGKFELGLDIYHNTLKRLKIKNSLTTGTDQNFKENIDLENLYLDLTVGINCIEDVLKDFDNEDVKKYFFSYKMQVKSVVNFLKDEINSDETEGLEFDVKQFLGKSSNKKKLKIKKMLRKYKEEKDALYSCN